MFYLKFESNSTGKCTYVREEHFICLVEDFDEAKLFEHVSATR